MKRITKLISMILCAAALGAASLPLPQANAHSVLSPIICLETNARLYRSLAQPTTEPMASAQAALLVTSCKIMNASSLLSTTSSVSITKAHTAPNANLATT